MRPFRFSFARSSSACGQVPRRDVGDLLGRDRERIAEVVLARAQVDADLPGVGVLRDERVHRVGHPPLLADLLEEPRRRRAAEDRIEQGGGEATPIRARDARRREADVVLLGVLALEAQLRRRRWTSGGRRFARARPLPVRRSRPRSARARRSRRARCSRLPRRRCSRARTSRRGSGRSRPAGIDEITSAVPITGRPSGCSPKTASAIRSCTSSCGASSYMAISSSTTSRSVSSSANAGAKTMSLITSTAVDEMVVGDARIHQRVLARRRGVQLAAEAVEDLRDLECAVAARPLEEQMLDEVRDARLRRAPRRANRRRSSSRRRPTERGRGAR